MLFQPEIVSLTGMSKQRKEQDNNLSCFFLAFFPKNNYNSFEENKHMVYRTPSSKLDFKTSSTLKEAISENPDIQTFSCIINNNSYFFVFNEEKGNQSFTAYKFDNETGEIGEVKNKEVDTLKSLKVWKPLEF